MRLVKGYEIKVGRFCRFSLKNKREFTTYVSNIEVKRIMKILLELDCDKYVAKIAELLDPKWHKEYNYEMRKYWVIPEQVEYQFRHLLEIKGKRARQLWLELNG